MNQAFVNAPIAFLPSFDAGAGVELQFHDLSLKGAFMNVGGEADVNFNFYGGQLGYTLTTPLGEGNYRIIANYASKEFLDPAGEAKKSLLAFVLSCDQQLGESLGLWIRLGFQDDDAAIDYKNFYSGGLNISGNLWGREQDNIGVAYALLDGGNIGVEKSQVVEGYVRLGLNEHVALSVHGQYMDDKYEEGAGDNVYGWLAGARMTVEF